MRSKSTSKNRVKNKEIKLGIAEEGEANPGTRKSGHSRRSLREHMQHLSYLWLKRGWHYLVEKEVAFLSSPHLFFIIHFIIF